ncbi:alpha/beta hydrolase [Synechococcus sp. PCC 6716]|nr:alpha/beta hydrolase [Synechococcus sp. PCC 6716]
MSLLDGPWIHKFIVSNGIRLHYVTQGEGDLVLLLHGFPEFWYSWRQQIPKLADHHKVVALDLRGYNLSDKPQDPTSYVLDELILDIVGVIDGLGYRRCHLVGHDWGGMVAWGVAYAVPDRIQTLSVLACPHPSVLKQVPSGWDQWLRSSYLLLFQLPWLPELLLEWGNYGAIAHLLQWAAVNQSAIRPADIALYQDAAAQRGALSGMLNYYRGTLPSILAHEWGTLSVPTQMLWGRQDPVLGVELTYNTEAYVKALNIHYLDHCGHFVQQEQPDLVNQYLLEWLDARPTAKPGGAVG